MTDSYYWTITDDPKTELGALQIRSISEFIANHPDALLDHDPTWLELKAKAHDASTRLYVCHDDNGTLVAYAPFFVHGSAFEFSYAGYKLIHISMQRHSITATPLFHPKTSTPESALQSLFECVRRNIPNRDVMFVLGLNVATAERHRNAYYPPGFIRMAHGPVFQHRRARIENSLEAYLARLGSKTRQDLRRHERRLLKEASSDVQISVHTEPETVAEFLDAVEHISRKTYQWNLLDIGTSNNRATADKLENSARNGWFRGYILYAQQKPIAFMIGHLYRGTYSSDTIGYDPSWHKFSVGNVLHLYVMRDLSALNGRAHWFDFMYGDNSNKERLGNDARLEQNVYFIPDTLRWRIQIRLLKSFNGTMNTVSGLLNRFGLKEKIRRALRKRASRSGEHMLNEN